MAETKQERKTFKWGDQEYLLDDLLKLHADQERYFYNFARDKGSYDESALEGLRSAITNRINAAKNGKLFGADGILDTDLVDNILIQTQKKGLFKKAKYVDLDNTEWAKYYMNQLMKHLKPTTIKTDPTSWDVDKRGLSALFKGLGYNYKDIFEQFDKRDKNNPDAPRSFDERNQLLDTIMGKFVDQLRTKKYDFKENDNEYDDDLLQVAENFVKNHRTMSPVDKAAVLRRMSNDEQLVKAFTSDKWELGGDEETTKKLKLEQDLKLKAKSYNDDIGGKYKIFEALPAQEAQMTAYLGQANSNFYRTPEEMTEWSDKAKHIDMDAYLKRYNANKWDVEAALYVLPVLQAAGKLKETTIDGTKYVYDPNSINRENHSFIAIDPVSGKMVQKFVYDIDNEIAALRSKYIDPQGASKYQLEISSNKEGGVLSMQTGGEFSTMDYLKQLKEKDYETRAKEQGIEVRQLKERERTPFGEKTLTGNSGFTGNDLVQLGTMAVDLASMFADPLTGAAMGFGTSTVNFINDINRDGWLADDGWNYLKSLGMDALGVIPIVGDTFGTLGKVKKGLLNLAPKIIGYLGMAQNVMNAPQIIDSFSKILDDRDMTTQDWLNVASGILTIVSGTRAGKDAIRNARAKKASLSADKLNIEVTDKAGNSKILVLDGENAKAVRDSDHSVKSVNEILKNIEDFLDYNVVSDSPTLGFSLKMPGRKVKNASTNKEELVFNPFELGSDKAKISAHYDPVAYARAYSGKKKKNAAGVEEPYVSSPLQWFTDRYLNTKNTSTDAVGKQNKTQVLEATQKRIDADVEAMKTRAKAYSDETTSKKAELATLLEQITGTNSEISANRASFDAESSKYDSSDKQVANINRWRSRHSKKAGDVEFKRMQSIEKVIKTTESKIKALAGKKDKASTAERKRLNEELNKYKADYKKIREDYRLRGYDVLEAAKKTREKAKQTKADLETRHQELLNILSGHTSTKGTLETRINAVNPEIARLLNPTETTITFNGQEYKLKPKDTFTEESLRALGIFNKGGVINRNKINKFLNYAKG